MSSICLIGFMGCGKTTIGEAISKVLDKECIDLDAYIVHKQNRSIKELFEAKGEAYFRQLETYYLKEIIHNKQSIISTGGGVVVTKENREVLHNQQTFYLKYPFSTLYSRIKGDESRPLAIASYEVLEKRYKDRLDFYKEACKYEIACEGKYINDIVKEIINKINI